MQIHQFVHTLNYGDAISGEALCIKRLLREQGYGSEIFSLHTHEKLTGEALHYSKFSEHVKDSSEDVMMILHYSIASPLNELFVNSKQCKRVIIYHNLTPPSWFQAYNHRVREDLEVGIKELPELCAQADIILADSEFNKTQLEEFGCEGAEVLPLPLDFKKWDIPENSGIASLLSGSGKKNLLHVGRIAPNKCIEDIIKPFYFYHHKINRDSKLWLIGADIDTEIYSFELRNLVSELRLKEAVEFVGSVADSELKAFYQNSDAYLCMSEHEGFCVPLLEAMHFELPVIAYNSSAVPETLAGAGLLVEEKKPAEIAELIDLLVSDEDLRSKLIELGNERINSFDLGAFRSKLLEKLTPSARELEETVNV